MSSLAFNRNSAGETFKADGGYRYYFQSGGRIVGNDTGNLPGINFAPLERLP